MINKTLAGIVASLPLVFGACDTAQNSCNTSEDTTEKLDLTTIPGSCDMILKIEKTPYATNVYCDNKDGKYTVYSRNDVIFHYYKKNKWKKEEIITNPMQKYGGK